MREINIKRMKYKLLKFNAFMEVIINKINKIVLKYVIILMVFLKNFIYINILLNIIYIFN